MEEQRVIYFENQNSELGNSVVSVSPKYTGSLSDVAIQSIIGQGLPDDTPWQEVEDALDPVFKNARVVENGKLVADLEKSRVIAHDIRRQIRSNEFLVVDNDNPLLIVNSEGEEARAAILAKHDAIQLRMDDAGTIEQLKGVMQDEGWVE